MLLVDWETRIRKWWSVLVYMTFMAASPVLGHDHTPMSLGVDSTTSAATPLMSPYLSVTLRTETTSELPVGYSQRDESDPRAALAHKASPTEAPLDRRRPQLQTTKETSSAAGAHQQHKPSTADDITPGHKSNQSKKMERGVMNRYALLVLGSNATTTSTERAIPNFKTSESATPYRRGRLTSTSPSGSQQEALSTPTVPERSKLVLTPYVSTPKLDTSLPTNPSEETWEVNLAFAPTVHDATEAPWLSTQNIEYLRPFLETTLGPGIIPHKITAPRANISTMLKSKHAGTTPSWPVKMAAVVDGDLVLGGLMMVHEREDSVTCGPIMPQGGIQALEAMLYTLDCINADPGFLPGITLGAHILDDCDKDTYGLEMAVDFIKGSISNIDDAEVQCNQSAARKVISGVVGAASSVTSIQVANLLRLFRIPQVSFFSTSPELSNKQRFEFFSRTIPSDHYQVQAMAEIVTRINWTYVSIVYEESNYGIKAYEELERVLSARNVCIAVKEKLVKDSGVAEEIAYDNIVRKLLTKPRARGVIIFGSDQEVAGVMRAVRRLNATGRFSWIGSDGWSARSLVSDGNEPEVEGTLSVQPQANPVKGFEQYFLNLKPDTNKRNPWFIEFWEAHFHCRYNNSPPTPHNQRWEDACAPDLSLTKNNTDFEDQLQFVSDAVMAFAYALKQMHADLCGGRRGLCDRMQPTEGVELLKYLRNVSFEGLSGDKFQFDENGDGPARYNIIHFKQVERGRWSWVKVGEYSGEALHLNMSEIQFQLEAPSPPESVCSLPCALGQARRYVERESCCWHCFNCTQYQIRNETDETKCVSCRYGTLPDLNHVRCIDIPEAFLRVDSGWAIGAMSFSCFGIVVTLLVVGVFVKHHDTPVVRASGRDLSYILLTGILLCFFVTFLLVLKPTDLVCSLQRFSAGFCFTVVYAALFIKTNRISRIFEASKHSAKRPPYTSPRSQMIFCAALISVQVLINVIWIVLSPPRAIHTYPTREDNVLVCSSHMDASYMIAFGFPIALIIVCTVYAVLTRKIPEAFNESQHIGFTMYTTCVIWLAFVPLFFATTNHVALRIMSMSVTISLSAIVTVACLFSPKLYIIIFHPERNVRQSMMPNKNKVSTTIKSSAATASTAVRPAVPTATIAKPSSVCVSREASGQPACAKLDKETQIGGQSESRSQQTSVIDLTFSTNKDQEGEGLVTNGDDARLPVKSRSSSATEVLTTNPARLSSLDFIDTDVERSMSVSPPITNNENNNDNHKKPTTVVNYNHSNHHPTSPASSTTTIAQHMVSTGTDSDGVAS